MTRNKKHNAYKEANEAFLQVKAQEEGMVVLDNGVLYKVLESGRGTKKPTPRSIVYVNYTGRLIDRGAAATGAFHGGGSHHGLADCPDADARRRQMGGVHPRQMGLRLPEDGRHPGAQHTDLRAGARQDRAVTENVHA